MLETINAPSNRAWKITSERERTGRRNRLVVEKRVVCRDAAISREPNFSSRKIFQIDLNNAALPVSNHSKDRPPRKLFPETSFNRIRSTLEGNNLSPIFFKPVLPARGASSVRRKNGDATLSERLYYERVFRLTFINACSAEFVSGNV